VGEDSQVPGMEIRLTSGQLASWKAGRGFRPGTLVGGTAVGGTAVGGVAVGGDDGRRTTITMIATTSPTTTATVPAATRARMRWRRRRSLAFFGLVDRVDLLDLELSAICQRSPIYQQSRWVATPM